VVFATQGAPSSGCVCLAANSSSRRKHTGPENPHTHARAVNLKR